jgi:flagellar biogenesis protein FliO
VNPTQMGEQAAQGFRKALTPSRGAMMRGGLGALALGGAAAYGLHRARKQRQQDMTNAVAQGIQQAQLGQRTQ